MSEYEPGRTAPPFHCWCRSVTVPYFDDDFGEIGERAARDENGKTYYVPADMTYKEWEKKYVVDAVELQNKKLYQKYCSILGNKAPKTIDEFLKIKYNNEEWNLFKAYSSSIKTGELTPLADFDLYKSISEQIDKRIVGLSTSNGIKITGKSNHSIARVIGSVEQRRDGVQISDVLNALTDSNAETLPIKNLKNGRSQKFRNGIVEVSVNPDTGNIIQVNPKHTKRKVNI